MNWDKLKKEDHDNASRLISFIDGAAKWNFENIEKDNDLVRCIGDYYLYKFGSKGIFISYEYKSYVVLYISFDNDIPKSAEDETLKLLNNIIGGSNKEKIIYCRNENQMLIRLIKNNFNASYIKESREMAIDKDNFKNWPVTIKTNNYYIFKGYEEKKHNLYIELLERSMSGIMQPGTYFDRSAHFKEYWIEIDEKCSFISVWCKGTLIGLCYSDGCEIDTLAVEEGYRGKGVGYFLLYRSLNNIFKDSDDPVYLYVADSNVNAYKFYMHIGMRVTGHKTVFYLK